MPPPGPERRDRLIRWSVAGNLFILIVFKYLDFVVDNVNVVLDAYWHWKIPSPHIPLPIGISFFTFHIISYLVDVYRGVAPPQRSPVPFALYIINFPQLIAGPIVRYRPISAQLTERTHDVRRFRSRRRALRRRTVEEAADRQSDRRRRRSSVRAGARRICRSGASGSAVVCYAMQIYFDFSGYSDMAIGMARMFGFRFPENFNYPYSAISIQDFWRRWHMTLSAWFRDYVYIPLGGSRGGVLADRAQSLDRVPAVRRVARRELEFHHLGHVARPVPVDRAHRRRRAHARPHAALLRNIYVLVVVLVGWVFFRSLTLDQALDMLTRMFGLQRGSETMLSLSSNVAAPTMALIVVAACLCYPVWPFMRDVMRADDGRAGPADCRMASSARALSV